MKTDAEQVEIQKNNLYRDNYRRVMIVIALGLSGILGYQIVTTPQPQYFATTTTGRVVPLQSLRMPVVTNSYLLQWAELAARTSYNLDFLNYASQLNKASGYFTSAGWKSFMDSLNSAKIIDSVRDNKLFMSAVVDGPAVILDEEVIHGRYTWRVQLPLLVTYTSASEHKQSHFIVTMDIMRMPVIDAVKSIQINDFNAVRG